MAVDLMHRLMLELEQWKDYYSRAVNASRISVGGNSDFCIKQNILFIYLSCAHVIK